LLQTKDIKKSKKIHDENVRSMMEMMKQDWLSIQLMPYKFFIETLKWKVNLEEEKKKKLEEENRKTSKTTSEKAYQKLRQRNQKL
jgi:hypothetical protein